MTAAPSRVQAIVTSQSLIFDGMRARLMTANGSRAVRGAEGKRLRYRKPVASVSKGPVQGTLF